MDYCSAHFGKKLTEVKFQDVVDFFTTEKTETDQLELKSFAGNVNENYSGLNRTICAFLNSKGGLLIWGAPSGVKIPGRKEKAFQGMLTPINEVLSKDPLISKCSDSITPLPAGIRVAIIENGNNECVCIFEIDESNYAPHQYDKTYLMRIDGQTKPAPHHYVEALFKKIRYPNLEGYLKIIGVNTPTVRQTTIYRIVFELYFFNWTPLQNEENFSFRILCAPGWFPQIDSNPEDNGSRGTEDNKQNNKEIFHFGEPIQYQYELYVHPMTLEEGLKVDILLAFGGRFSPLKTCHYQINLGYPTGFTKPNSILKVVTENQLSKDYEDQKEITRESRLKSLGIVRKGS